MGRLYPGLYSVLVVLDNGEYQMTEPTIYEEAERRVLLHGFGVQFEGRHVVKALIVGPVAHTADIPVNESHSGAV